MSTAALDLPRAADLPTTDVAGPNFLATARRRWPWMLVGLLVGLVGGFLAYTARPAIYQSTCQLMVIKKTATLMGTSDMRNGMVEDYVSAQVTLLKSEKILLAAARQMDPAKLRTAIPEDPRDRGKLLGNLLAAAREKDPNNPTAITNILNLSLRGPNPDDCQAMLDIVVRTYQGELKKVYDEATEDRLNLLTTAITATRSTIDSNMKLRGDAQVAMRTRTVESPNTLQTRVATANNVLRQLTIDELETIGTLKTITDAGTDVTKRADTLRILGNDPRRAIPGITNKYTGDDPNLSIRQLQSERADLETKYGPDHPNIRQLNNRIKFYEETALKLNPSDPKGEKDNLHLYEAILTQRLATLKTQIAVTRNDVKDDTAKLDEVLPFVNQIDFYDKANEARNKQLDEWQSERMKTDLTRLSGGYQATVISEPSREPIPVAPKLSQSLLLGAAAGLLFGVGLAALAELSDKGFRSPAEIRARLGLPVIGHIPPIRLNLPAEENGAEFDLDPSLVSALRPKSIEAEAYRGVRTAIYFNAAGSSHQMIQVTSPNQGDGKSTLAANLAISIAQSGKRVLLVDCDMRRPRVHRIFHLPEPGPGLAAVIMGEATIANSLRRTAVENLSLLPCGKKPQNPAELLTSPQFPELLDRLKADFDFVILDTPPMLAVSDPSAVAPRADGVILVFRMSNRVRPAAERAREQLAQLGANVIGVVVNGTGRTSEGYGYGSEYTGYTSDNLYVDNYAEEDDDEPNEPDDGTLRRKG